MSACPICGGSEGNRIPHGYDVLAERYRAEADDTAPYFWTLCGSCGNAYPSVQPNASVLSRLWSTNRTVNEAEAQSVWRRRVEMARVAANRSYATFAPIIPDQNHRMLDIACGLGETVAIFARHGWQAEGIDIDAQTKRFHEDLGITTHIGRIEDAIVEGPYEFIHIAHAIYFISQPMQFLQRVRELLPPDGVFAVVISDFLASTDDARPSYWHTFYPCAASMRAALSRAGLAPIMTKTWGGSIYIAARRSEPRLETPNIALIKALYATKVVRYNLLGRPNLAVRKIAKRILGRAAS